jgi:hypothetical protein
MSKLNRRGFLGALTAGAGLANAGALEGPLAKATQSSSPPRGKPFARIRSVCLRAPR